MGVILLGEIFNPCFMVAEPIVAVEAIPLGLILTASGFTVWLPKDTVEGIPLATIFRFNLAVPKVNVEVIDGGEISNPPVSPVA